jgi:hypothetical protein
MLQTQDEILSRVWPLVAFVVLILLMLKGLSLIPAWLALVVLVAGSIWVVRVWWLR